MSVGVRTAHNGVLTQGREARLNSEYSMGYSGLQPRSRAESVNGKH